MRLCLLFRVCTVSRMSTGFIAKHYYILQYGLSYFALSLYVDGFYVYQYHNKLLNMLR